MEGPDGTSVSTDIKIPIITEKIPIRVEATTIISGELTSLLAVAAGIINIAVINKSPIICNDKATTMVKTEVNNKFMYRGFIPSAFARSSSTVTKSNDDQLNNIRIIAKKTPIYIPQISFGLTVKMSPNKIACRSILILLNEITIIPIARATWANTPNRVSDERALLCCNHKNRNPKTKQTKTTPIFMPTPSNIPIPAPSKEPVSYTHLTLPTIYSV